jgi:hypothetical protein
LALEQFDVWEPKPRMSDAIFSEHPTFHGPYSDVAEGVEPIQVFRSRHKRDSTFYGVAQSLYEFELL